MRHSQLLLAALLAATIAGCSGSSGTSSPTPTPTAPVESESVMVPFVLPWDDGSAGITNMGDRLNHKPAGKYGSVTTNSDGHFALNGERIRFWGVNVTGRSCFPTHEEAKAIARRLAKFGVNLVRFHHMDHNWGGLGLIDYSQGNSNDFDAEALERLDYFIAELKAQGIYTNLNLINAREFSASDSDELPQEVNSMGWKERHVLGFFMPALRDLEKDYAQKLLNHQNPYTNLRYSDDPAVAFVEVNNENSLIQQYYDGGVRSWPAPVRNVLQAEWNQWLGAQYANTAALEEAWGASSEPLGEELLTNGSFTDSTESWDFESLGGAKAVSLAGQYDGRQGLALRVDQTGEADWHVQFHQSPIAVTEGQLYTLSFAAKADNISEVAVALQQAYEPWGVMESRNVELTGDWREYSLSFYASASDSNLRMNFGGLGDEIGTFFLTDVSLRPGGAVGYLAEGESLEAGNIALNQRNSGYTLARSKDWMRFLRDLEYDYWSDMHAYVRDTLNVQALVTGTQLMNSTPSIQKEFPFIDAHAYWQHPVFPRVDWDMADWTVGNESMVNTLDNTIYQLSRQRVAGKPFTVSEYQHSSPNTYSSEAPLLVAAYGALQDWDGIYLFSYDAGAGNSWNPGYFSNFFSLNAHPTKMANLALAANIFRRGDVEAAQNQVLLNISPERELDILATRGASWNVANGSHLGIDPTLAHVNRIALDASDDPSGLEQPPQGLADESLRADTGQLLWDISHAAGGVVQVNTATSKAVIGFAEGRKFTLGNVSITVGDTVQDWATVGLTMQAGSFDTPRAPGSLLIVATGLTENTGMQWASSSRNSVGAQWGRSPSLVEVIPMTVDLPFPAAQVRGWTLDEKGQRNQPLSVQEHRTGSRLELSADTATLWYEVDIAPAQ